MLIGQKPASPTHEALNPKGGSRPSAAEQIRRQIGQLQQQLEKMKESKDSPETKSGRIKELNAQIQQLQQNLQQATMDESQQIKEEAASKAAEKAQEEAVRYQKEEQLQAVRQSVNLFAVTGKLDEMKTLHRVKTDMIAKKNYAGAAQMTDRIMQKSMEVQEVLKRGSAIKPKQIGHKQDEPSAADAGEVQQKQNQEGDSLSAGEAEEPGRKDEGKR
jgi:hypothetical protein